MNMIAKGTAHIEQWWVHETFNGKKCLIGTISKHYNQGAFHSDVQITSELIHLDEENKKAETKNTIYTLGTKRELPYFH